jgi:hypothetical protein
MYAADGTPIPFPARYRRSEAYQTARSVLVDIFLDVDPEALDIIDSEPAVETGPDGEIDFESFQGRYSSGMFATLGLRFDLLRAR